MGKDGPKGSSARVVPPKGGKEAKERLWLRVADPPKAANSDPQGIASSRKARSYARKVAAQTKESNQKDPT